MDPFADRTEVPLSTPAASGCAPYRPTTHRPSSASSPTPNRRAELGFALRRDRWGRGLMTEALPVLLRCGFEKMDLHRVEADVDPRNAASIKQLERLGFRREGYLREGYLRERHHTHGEPRDALFYGLLRHEAPFLRERCPRASLEEEAAGG